MMSGRDTRAATLLHAYETGRNAGLHFVYAGNLPGAVGACEDTVCPVCNTPLIRRYGFRIVESRVSQLAGARSAMRASRAYGVVCSLIDAP